MKALLEPREPKSKKSRTHEKPMKKQFLQLSLAATLGLPAVSIAQNIFPANGNVGIGTSVPDAHLTISGSAYSGAESSFIGAHIKNVGDGGDVSLWLQNSSKNAYIRLKNNYASEWLKFDDGTNTRMVIDNSGKTGIGTSQPTKLLDVNGDARVNGWLEIDAPATTAPRIQSSRQMFIQTAGVQPLFLNAFEGGGDIFVGGAQGSRPNLIVRGDFGVGTDSPQAKLHVAGSAMVDLSPTGGGRLQIGNNPNDNRIYIQAANSAGTEVAAEMVFAGFATRSLPKFSVVANESAFSGKVSVTTLELTSDRNQKQDLRPVSSAEVLAKVSKLPVASWAYTNSPGVRHLGPMAQDFKAAFGLGEDDKHIGAGDGIGVALAAIQGMYQLVTEKDSEIATLKRELASMRKELSGVQDGMTACLARIEKMMEKRDFQPVNLRVESTR